MAAKNGIGYSPLTDKVYLGKQNPDKRMWVGNKTDITNEFLAVTAQFFEENTVREIVCSDDSSNLFINIKNDKASLEKVIKNLSKRVEKLK
jgi:predicted membrane protein